MSKGIVLCKVLPDCYYKNLLFKKRKQQRRITFQRKFIVIPYMGERPPKHYKDSVVALRGVLPEIEVEATESDVRREIAGVLANSGEEYAASSEYSFEFIEANGKHLYVPAKLLVLSGLERPSNNWLVMGKSMFVFIRK